MRIVLFTIQKYLQRKQKLDYRYNNWLYTKELSDGFPCSIRLPFVLFLLSREAHSFEILGEWLSRALYWILVVYEAIPNDHHPLVARDNKNQLLILKWVSHARI
jgi:hypothetical protein